MNLNPQILDLSDGNADISLDVGRCPPDKL